MANHKIHPSMPSGFDWADDLQVAQYNDTGFVNGAAKVVFVAQEIDENEAGTPRVEIGLGVRLRPPSDEIYADEYRMGWSANHGTPDEMSHRGFHDGFRDCQENRMKWHLAYCENHGDHEGGCGV